MVRIILDATKDIPLYRQIIEQIAQGVKDGRLKTGDRLPSERELSEELKVARGTVKQAYEELSRTGIIEINRGRGTFVGAGSELVEMGRKERATRKIDEVLNELEKMRFTPREIENLIRIKLLERLEKKESFHVAAVDCNTESLEMFRKQLSYMKGIDLKKFLLEEVIRDVSPEKRLNPFKLILVTSTHYKDLIGRVSSLRNRVVQVAVSPSPETILELAGIGMQARVGIVCESRTFAQIIQNKLRDFHIAPRNVETLLIGERGNVAEFVGDKDVVIIPPGYSFEISRDNKALFQRFREQGGKVIHFEYRIERGSLLYLEERIKELMEQ